MKTLIITVGTRQVGWRCRDGVVRSFGADGDRGHPPHIDELYAEFGLARGHHGDTSRDEFRQAARHLGEVAYRHCEQVQDFSAVELLMDGVILAQSMENGLTHVILWGTDQPEGTPWNFRRGDTVWLAHLMAGKIRQLYPHLTVDVWNPVVAVNQVTQIQNHLQDFLVRYTLTHLCPETEEPLTIQIQTKGSAPQIASSLEICAAALMRQCTVQQLIPAEPEPLFAPSPGNQLTSSARTAQEYKVVSLGEYFWPVERERILSAWQRGDFAEAKVWLENHRDRYMALYEIASDLALATNWQLQDALKGLQKSLENRAVARQVTKPICKQWRQQIEVICKRPEKQTPESQFLDIWESRVLIYWYLKRQNYTAAFMQLVQTLERLLFWRYRQEDWIEKQYVTLPPDKQNWSVKKYKATFADLRYGWQRMQKLPDDAALMKQLEAINEQRNQVVHSNASLTFDELINVICPFQAPQTTDDLYAQIVMFLQQFCPAEWPMPARSLLEDVYHWGLQQLQPELSQ